MEGGEREGGKWRVADKKRKREREEDEDGLTWRCWLSSWTERCSRSRRTWSISGAVGYAPPLGHFRTCVQTHTHNHHVGRREGCGVRTCVETQVPVMATGECAKEPKEKSGHNKEKEG